MLQFVPRVTLCTFMFYAALGGGFQSRAFCEEAAKATISSETEECLDCHRRVTPGIVADWQKSRHAVTTPNQTKNLPENERRMSSLKTVPEALRNSAVGCYECHSLNPTKHRDNFEHMGYQINVVVTPDDCKSCHETEAKQYADSKKAHALANLRDNPIFQALVEESIAIPASHRGQLPDSSGRISAQHEACYSCHGTEVKVVGKLSLEDEEAGEFEVPKLSNWPNQGVGRKNPDGSLGSCTACHARHAFSISVARKPETCSQCHAGPDAPAYKVFIESKHGNLVKSDSASIDWQGMPWKVGTDFQAPSCSVCHSSALVTPDGNVIAKRTHDFGARLWTRIFGLPTSHPQPVHGNTATLRNKDGQPLPTSYDGTLASEGLLKKDEIKKRQQQMQAICKSCHSTGWVQGHFEKFENTVDEADKMVLAATALMQQAWKEKRCDAKNMFDEELERLWVKQWLYYANALRLGSAMSGFDYSSFQLGWFDLTGNMAVMQKRFEELEKGERK